MVSSYFPLLLTGAWLSLRVALASLALALFLGLLNAGIKLFGPAWMRACASVYTTVVRGIPELVLMLLLYFSAEQFFNMVLASLGWGPVAFNQFFAGVLALGFIFGAYFTEAFRGAFLAVPKGQLEAGLAFGMSPLRIFTAILAPQMLRHALPASNNLWLALMKSAALISLIGLEDMVWLAEQAGRATQSPFLFYLGVCIFYLVVTAASGSVLGWLMRRYPH